MGIMDMFRSVTGNGPAPGAVATPAQQVPGSQTQNPTVPSGSTPQSDGSLLAIPKAGEGETSPLDGFKDLWNTSNDPKSKDYIPPSPTTAFKFNVDPAKMMESARAIDFTKTLSPELAARITKNEPGAVMEAINAVGQASYVQAAATAANLINSALEKQAAVFKTQVMPDILRKNSVSQQLRADNPIFDNPAVAPMLSMVEAQIVAKSPGLSPAEITTKAKEYLSGFASEFLTGTGKVISDKPVMSKKSSREPEDWGAFFGVDEVA